MQQQHFCLSIIIVLIMKYPSKASMGKVSKGSPYIKNCENHDECPNGSACLLPGYEEANQAAQKKCYACNCMEKSQCYHLNSIMFCDCTGNGFTGVNCDINIDDCCPMPCLNGATCVDGINNYSCICAPGYNGTHCETDIDECQNDPCMYNGSCNDWINEYTCTCAPGFTGPNCEINIDECVVSPCLNDATCNDGIDEYTCTCAPGYTGFHCDVEIIECYPMPCLNGATCVDEINDYSCICAPGYAGTNCETNINECNPNQCVYGPCTDGINGYTCTCDSGYTGTNCDIEINECMSQPCLNSGTCNDLVNDYTCTCPQGYTGIICEIDLINDCDPCLNGGIFGYNCTCPPEYVGFNCEEYSPCLSFPCAQGQECIDLGDDFECCNPGFVDADFPSQPYTCLVQGCQDSNLCTCTPGYTGPNCNIHNTPLCATSIKQTFTSPGYPCRYFHNLYMRWKIIAPAGKKVKFWINDFSIDEGFDFFYVHDGNCDGALADCMNLGVYTGNTIDFFYHDYAHTYFNYRSDLDAALAIPFITTSNFATLTFTTEGIIAGFGFRICYLYID